MGPKKTQMLFGIGAIGGGITAILLWSNFSRFGGWVIAGILLAVWFAMGIVSIYLLRRRNRRR